MQSAPAIAFDYRPSRVLRGTYSLIVLLALVAISLSALPWWTETLLVGLVLTAGWRTWLRLARAPFVGVRWSTSNQWSLCLASTDEVLATLLSFHVYGAFVQVRLHAPELGVQTLFLGADNSDADVRRRLRMRLAALQREEALPRI